MGLGMIGNIEATSLVVVSVVVVAGDFLRTVRLTSSSRHNNFRIWGMLRFEIMAGMRIVMQC